MRQRTQHWITLHRIRFAQPVAVGEQETSTVPGASCWRFCPAVPMSETNLPADMSDEWCGLGIWTSQDEAQTMIDAPDRHLPCLSEAQEAWHALAVPFAHRGSVNWRGEVEHDYAVSPADEDPGGRLAVVTSAGFEDGAPDLERRQAHFLSTLREVNACFRRADSILRAAVYDGGADGRDGLTLSIWNTDEAMVAAAYQPGGHRGAMVEHRTTALMDRSSYTRMRVVRSLGTWDGRPVALA